MPLRAYQPVNRPCRLCGDGFDHMQPAGAAPLTSCPKCGEPVLLRAAHTVATPQASKRPSVSEAKQAGFSVLKKTSDGSFEKQ